MSTKGFCVGVYSDHSTQGRENISWSERWHGIYSTQIWLGVSGWPLMCGLEQMVLVLKFLDLIEIFIL